MRSIARLAIGLLLVLTVIVGAKAQINFTTTYYNNDAYGYLSRLGLQISGEFLPTKNPLRCGEGPIYPPGAGNEAGDINPSIVPLCKATDLRYNFFLIRRILPETIAGTVVFNRQLLRGAYSGRPASGRDQVELQSCAPLKGPWGDGNGQVCKFSGPRYPYTLAVATQVVNGVAYDLMVGNSWVGDSQIPPETVTRMLEQIWTPSSSKVASSKE
jgi:hypothetical protein